MKGVFAKKAWALVLIAVLFAMTVSACSSSKKGENEGASSAPASSSKPSQSEPAASESPAAQLPPLTYSVFTFTQGVPAWVDPKDDVLAQYIEKRFNIKVGNVTYLQGMTFKERMNLFVASGELPDVIHVFGDNVTVPATGKYAELGDLIKQYMPNFMKLAPESYWNDQKYDGKMYNIGSISLDGTDPAYQNDINADPTGSWNAIWTSESTLAKAGYKFTPMKDLVKKFNETGRKPTYDDFKIEPEIKTPDDFYNFLKKIKETSPKVGGQDVIPFDIPIWLEPHFGYSFGMSGWWKYDPDTQKLNGFLDDVNAKPYWQFMNKLYKEGLLDKDFAVQKLEQMNEKILQTRVKAFMWSANNADVQAALQKIDPNDNLRAIPLPMQPGAKPRGIDHLGRISHAFYIRKDFPDIPRLLKYFDWALSQEAQDLMQWGPEELGLWEMKDGKKVWKNQEMYNAIAKNDVEYLKANYWSKGLGGGSEALASKAFNSRVVPFYSGYNPYSWKNSYPRVYDANDLVLQQAYVSMGGNDYKGFLSPGGDEASSKVTNFVYGEFEQQFSPKLFAAKNDQEFEKGWKEVIDYWNGKVDFAAGKKSMEDIYRSRGFDVKN